MDNDQTWAEKFKELEAKWAQASEPVTDVRAFVSAILKSHNLSNDAINKRYLPVLLEEIAFEQLTDSRSIARVVVEEIKKREERVRNSAPFKPKPDPDNLDDWFPRGEKNVTNPNPSPTDSIDPDGDAPVRPAAHWSQDEDKVMKFWLSADKVHKTRNLSAPIRPALEAFMKAHYGSPSLTDIPVGMKGAELLAEYGKYIDSLEKKDEKKEFAAPPPPPHSAPPKPRPPSAPNYAPLSGDEVRRKYTVDLKGKQYLQVAGRILLFRADHPIDTGWAIKTTIMNATDTAVVFLAEIANPEGVVVASGHGRAVATQAGNYGGRIFEKAETAAIGRALANAGYGTDEVDETESPEHLADSPVNPS